MRKKINTLAVILFFSLLPMAFFTSCDKDTNCYLEVLVTDLSTKKPVKNVKIEVKQDGGTVHASGKTDTDGKYTAEFTAPAIVQVKADLSVADNGHRRAETSIRLQEGETVTANILLPKTVTY